MAQLIDDLRQQGFEIVLGDNGEELVKMLFTTGESDVTSCVYVAPDIAKRVIDGELTPNFDTDGVTVVSFEEVGETADQIGVVEEKSEAINNKEILNDEKSVEGQKYHLSEVSFFNETGQQVQMVTLSDEEGIVLDRKQGSIDEKVLMEVNGQLFEYTFVGVSENGEPTKTTIVLTSTEGEVNTDENIQDPQTQTVQEHILEEEVKPSIDQHEKNDKHDKNIEEEVLADGDKQIDGQKYCLTEETVLTETGQSIQMVTLTDENDVILDQKQGVEGNHVLMEINGQPFEYVFMGQSEDGQPLKTTIVLTTGPEGEEDGSQMNEETEHQPQEEIEEIEAEASLTAAEWCPPEMDLDVYTVIRHQTYALVQVKCPPDPFGKPLYFPEQSHQRNTANYKRLTELALTYKCGASNGETLDRYLMLREFSRVFRFSAPTARPLTKYEMAINEASAQVCRYQPSMLFNKPELLRFAQEIVEMCQISLQQAGYPEDILSNKLTGNGKSQKPITTAAVPSGVSCDGKKLSCKLASSQLAMLESRGLSQKNQDSELKGDSVRNSLLASQQHGYESNNEYQTGQNKRDSTDRLSQREIEAVQASALKILPCIENIDLKYKIDCTALERSCWELANEMMKSTQVDADKKKEHFDELVNSSRMEVVKEASVIYGKSQNLADDTNGQLSQYLTPFEMACNEASVILCAGIPALLTNRNELVEYAKRSVRGSGINFPHTPNADRNYRLFCPDQLPELDLSAAEQLLLDPMDPYTSGSKSETSKKTTSSDSTDEIDSLDMSCDEGENYLDDVSIFTLTGTDSLKRVRILNVADNLFTGLIPLHVNSCVNLLTLNLENNSIRSFPRCIHLPNLQTLNLKGNPKLLASVKADPNKCLPLIEQFPKITSVTLDPEMVPLLKRQSLAYLCPNLKKINEEPFDEEPSNETIKVASAAKSALSSLVFTKWEEDLSGFYKKGITKKDLIRIIETLVLYSLGHASLPTIPEPFSHCREILTRRLSEEFLSTKLIENEDDEEYSANSNRNQTDSNEQGKKMNEGDNLSTFSSNSILYPEEPLDKLNRVVGQAIRQGKTVVYSVMRSAARQPNGELIPVGQSFNNAHLNDSRADELNSEADANTSQEAEGLKSKNDNSDHERGNKKTSKPKTGSQITNKSTASVISQNSSTNSTRSPIISTHKHFRDTYYVGPSKAGKVISEADNTVVRPQENLNNAMQTGYVLGDEYAPQAKVHQPWQPGKRGRPPGYHTKKRTPEELEHVDTDELKRNIEIPKTREERSSNVNMSLRESNKNKRFSSYGALDTEALRKGDVDALIAANYAYEDAEEANHFKTLDQNSPVKSRQTNENVLEEDVEYTPSSMSKSVKMEERSPTISNVVTTSKLANHQSKMNTPKVNYAESLSQQQILQQQQQMLLQHQQKMLAQKRPRSDSLPLASPSNIKVTKCLAPSQLPPASASVQKRQADMSNRSMSSNNSSIQNISIMDASQMHSGRHPSASSNASIDPVNRFSALSYFGKVYGPSEVVRGIVESAIRDDHSVEETCLSKLAQNVDYDPLHFIRCHAKDNDPLDSETKVWRCVFEPDPNDPYNATTNVVATSGGECVCLVDCCSGKVMKRFKQAGEEFYTVAWTTVQMTPTHRTNLLAAAGRLKEIRLLHPDQLVCYAEMRGHTDEISCMIFHPSEPTILFSGDAKAMVLVWDIGIPTAPEYHTKHSLLMKLIIPRPDLNPVLNLIFLPKYNSLLAGCEDGVFTWTLTEFKKYDRPIRREADIELKIPTRKEPCFDGLSKVSENLIAVKCVDEGEIYILDYGQIVLRMMERNSALTRPVPVDIIGQVKWQQTDELYMNTSARQNISTLTCGDDKGIIWLYDMKEYVKNIGQIMTPYQIQPVKVLEWPECSIQGNESVSKIPVINTTDISSNGEFLVAVTDNNLVCIWKFSGY